MTILTENPTVNALTILRKRVVDKYSELELWDMYAEEKTHKLAEKYLIAYHFPLILHQIKKLKHQNIDHGLVFANALNEMLNAFKKFNPTKGKFSTYFISYFFYTKVIPETLNNNLITLNPTNYQLQNRIKRLRATGMKKEDIIKKLHISDKKYDAIVYCPKCSLIDQYNCEKDDND